MSLLHPGIEAFMAIVHQGTVHGAARTMGLSQTGVTQRIRALERQLGVTLFTRSRKGMRLTTEGNALVRYCQRAGDLEGELLSSLNEDSRAAAIAIQITGPSSFMRSRVVSQTTSALANYPGVTLTFRLDDYDSGLTHLKTGAAELAILPRADVVNELDSKLLAPGRYQLLGPAAWADRSLEDIVATERIIDFNEADDATFAFLKQCGLLDQARKKRHLANSPDAIAGLIAQEAGYSVLPEDFAEPLLSGGSLIDLCPEQTMDFDLALAWYPRHEMPGYFRALIDSIV
jgi:LysR family transcriptional regulator, chromosome initiation inhibitor